MQRLRILFLFFFTAPVLADAQLENRIYYFSEQSRIFQQICFDNENQFLYNQILTDTSSSIRDTTFDCNAQAIALNEEAQAIQAAIAAGGPDCDLDITDPNLIALVRGMPEIVEQVECPGSGGATQCVGDIGCNVANSMVSLFTAGVSRFLVGSNPLQCSGNQTTNCAENLIAGIVFAPKDLGCFIGSLFGYRCDQQNDGANAEQAATDAATMAAFQNRESVTRFQDAPFTWMGNMISSFFSSIGESIMERFGCAQWSGSPFASECLRPMSWSCADCSTRVNMVCGVLGYVVGDAVTSIFTGGAVGLVSRAAGRIAQISGRLFPRGTALAARIGSAAGRVTGVAARGLWRGISQNPVTRNLGAIVGGINRTARKNIIGFGRVQDAATAVVVGAARRYNQLSQRAFDAGFRATAQGQASAIREVLRTQYVTLANLRNGRYGGRINGQVRVLRTPEEYLESIRALRRPEERRFLGVTVTRDGVDSRIIITDSRAVDVGSGRRFDLSTGQVTPQTPRPTVRVTYQQPRPAPAVTVVDELPPPVTPDVPIEVTGSRTGRTYDDLPASTRSEADVIRALGPETAVNRSIAIEARGSFRSPDDFKYAARNIHEAWMDSNQALRATQPELFRPFDELTLAQQARFGDDLERGLRSANPDLISSQAYRDYRASLRGDAVAPNGSITVGDNTGAAVRLGDNTGDVRIAGTADQIPVTPATGARLDPVRVGDGSVSAARLTGDELRELNRRSLLDPFQRSPASRSQRGGQIDGLAAEVENAMNLEDLARVYRQWDGVGPGLRQDVLRFLDDVSDVETRRRYFAILINSPGGNPTATLERLRRLPGGRQAVLDELDVRIRDLNTQLNAQRGRVFEAVEPLARERSALLLQRTLLNLGDDVEIRSIFTANAHNQHMRNLGYNPNSARDTFSVDIAPRPGRPLDICRGSFAGRSAQSNLVGGYLTICRDVGYIDTDNFGRNLAAPVDTTTRELNRRGVSRISRFQIDETEVITLGQNGPVRYTARGQEGSGGVGGAVELFGSRRGTRLSTNNLQASVRTLPCQRVPGSNCDRLFAIQEASRAGSLDDAAFRTLGENQAELNRIIAGMAPDARRALQNIDNVGFDANIDLLFARNPELVAAMNLRRELELKRATIIENRRINPGRSFPLDAETRAFAEFANESRTLTTGFSNRVRGLDASSFTEIRAALETSIREAAESQTVRAYRQTQNELAGTFGRVAVADDFADPIEELYGITQRLGRLDDAYSGVRGVASGLSGSISRIRGLTPAQVLELRGMINRGLPGNTDLGDLP